MEQLTHGQLPEPERELQRLAALQSHGGDRRSEEARKARGNQVDNINLKGGTQAAYLKARLQRDHPEIAEQLEAGQFRSARAAGIAAGFIKPVPTVRLTNDMPAVAAKLCQHLSREQRIQLIDLLAPDL